MVSKTISITEPVYELLVRHKQPNESFSQLFQRAFTSVEQRNRNIEACIGAWADLPEALIEQMKAEISKGRHSFTREFELISES